LLVPGLPPFLRLESGVKAVRTWPVDEDDVAGVVKSVTCHPKQHVEQADGLFSFDVVTNPRWYRVAVFCDPPEGRTLVMSMPAAQQTIERGRQVRAAAQSNEPPPPPTPKEPFPSPPAWDRTLETIVRKGRFLLMASGAPPLLRDAYGLRAFYVQPLDPAKLNAMLQEVRPNADRLVEHDGYVEFELRYGDEYRFQLVAVGQPEAHLIAVTRLR
jgi:hypothetical protein